MSEFVDIIPRRSIGNLAIGQTMDQVVSVLGGFDEKDVRASTTRLKKGGYEVVVNNDTKLVEQIGVVSKGAEKYLGVIGVGDTLSLVRKTAGDWYEELDVYHLVMSPGICFELDDDEKYDVLEREDVPIVGIYVF